MSDDQADGDKISVLIVAFRSQSTIPRCLEALARQTVKPFEVLLLENGSPVGERLAADNLPDWVTFIDSDENLGFAGGNNHLARQASGDWLAFLNPDAFARDDWIEALLRGTREHPDIALFGSTQYAADVDGVLDGVGDVYHAAGLAYRAGYGKPEAIKPGRGYVFGPCAAASLVRRDVFEFLNGYDEAFFCYNEDVDLAFRARLLGYPTIQLETAKVDHLGYASSGRRSEFATYYGVRNRLWTFLKNVPGWLFWLILPLHVAATMSLWVSAARFGQFALFGKAIRDALGGWSRVMKQRRQVQASRRVSAMAIARAMSWNPVRLLTRAPDVRAVKPSTD